MFLYSKALLSIGDASRNFKTITDIVEEYGVVHIMRNNTPEVCVISSQKYPWRDLPPKIPTMTVTEANQRFANLLKLVYRFGVVCLTKRGKIIYYVINTDVIDEHLNNIDVIERQILEFYTGFTKQYKEAEDLIGKLEEVKDYV